VLKMLIRRTGLRPILSDNDPKKEALKKEKREKVANNKVTPKGETPKFST